MPDGGSIFGNPTVQNGPGALAPVYGNPNPALAIFDTASENPLAASLGILSPTGLAGVNSSGSFSGGSSPSDYQYADSGLFGGSVPSDSTSCAWWDITCHLGGGGTNSGKNPVTGSALNFNASDLLTKGGLIALGLVLLLGAFIYMGRTHIG